MVLQVGETGHTVGVEHISELVERSIDAIKMTPAAALMEKGNLVVHGRNPQPPTRSSCLTMLASLHHGLVHYN